MSPTVSIPPDGSVGLQLAADKGAILILWSPSCFLQRLEAGVILLCIDAFLPRLESEAGFDQRRAGVNANALTTSGRTRTVCRLTFVVECGASVCGLTCSIKPRFDGRQHGHK